MKTRIIQILLVTLLPMVLAACSAVQSTPTITPTPAASTVSTSAPSSVSPTPTSPQPTPTSWPPTPTPVAPGKTLVINISDDDGPGSLRQALLDAQPGDIITFDSEVFPPNNPVTISLQTGLPALTQGSLTIDASSAGVILDGSEITDPNFPYGLHILSDSNTIRGLQIVGFSNAGIALEGGASYNIIGGDRETGSGPLGQGNLINGNGEFGIGMWETSYNTILGNYIGITLDGKETRGHSRDGIHSASATNNLITDNVIGGNATGIYLCCVADGNNIVTANFIGTDVNGETRLGNGQGILIDQTSRNVIGPGNNIAFNNSGITFWLNTPYNTITQNSIHDNRAPDSFSENRRPGIDVGGASDPRRVIPIILDFDLQAGELNGLACANCIVEIFSDSEDEGATYEGQTVTDSRGFFTFSKAGGFSRLHLTATATFPDGSTTEFSRATQETSQTLILQVGNSQAKFRIQTKPSGELAENRMSLNFDQLWELTDETREELYQDVITLGVKRFDTSIHEVEPPINWSAGSEFVVSENVDRLIDDLIEEDVAINIDLYFWDKDGYANGEELSTPRFKTEQQVQDFLDFVRFIVGHFKGRVQYYAIWGEPGACGDGGIKCVRPLDYIELARRTIPVIRAEDPEAKIVLAPVVLFFGRQWLFTVLNSDVIQQFDVIKTHPFYDAAPDIPLFENYYYSYPNLIKDIMNTATANGFQGEYWGTDLTWWDEGNPKKSVDGQPWPSHTQTQGIKYMTRVIIIHLGLDASTGVSVLSNTRWIYPRVRLLTTTMAGASPDNLSVEIESSAKNIMSYGFGLPEGEKLFALWTNGVAVDIDPGVSATLTFPGLSASKVIALDILNDYEQELTFEMVDGNLVIRNLLVMDYPIILRIIE